MMNFSKFEIIGFILALIFTICLGGVMFISLYEYSKSGADWVSALIQTSGNILGGILGGIIAYIVAKYQIDRQITIQKKKQLSATMMKLCLIRFELNNNKVILETIEEKIQSNLAVSDFTPILQNLSNNAWLNTIIDTVISEDLLVMLDKTYTKILFYKGGTPSKSNIDLLEKIKNDINTTLSKLNNIIISSQESKSE